MTTKTQPTYQAMETELREVITSLETGELDIDAAVSQYARALAIIKELEARLVTAENRIVKLAATQEK